MRISDWSSDVCSSDLGSDAIAGVINIILKSDRSGGSVSVTGGSYYEGDGDTLAESGHLAMPIGDGGYFDVTVFRSEEHTSELQSLMRISYAVFCLKKKKNNKKHTSNKMKLYKN